MQRETARSVRRPSATSHCAVVAAGLVVAVLVALAPAGAQQDAPPALTAADYERAEQMLGASVNPLVLRAGVDPEWTANERFWYRVDTERGSEFMLVDAAAGTRAPAFDHERLAAGLSQAAGEGYEPFDLPFNRIEPTADGEALRFSADGRDWLCHLDDYRCVPDRDAPAAGGGRGGRGGGGRGGGRPEIVSPDGALAAFIREDNLWVRHLATGEEQPLTRDGIPDYGYATDNAGWRRSDRPVVKWSPDSRKIATFQQDQRGVGEMYLVDTRVGHPNLEAWKYPLPGDAVISMIERVVIDIDQGTLVRLQMPPDQHRSSLCDDVICGGSWDDVQWAPDGRSLMFLSTSRDHRQEWLRLADTATGEVREVLYEEVDTFFESGNGEINWRYLPESGEFIWYSQRTDWGHLYLYDLASGELKHPITSGDGNVARVVRVDQDSRQLWFLGVGMEAGRDPYFMHLYRVSFDGGPPTLLTPEDANHSIDFSPAGDYFVDTYSRPDTPPVSVLRRADGTQILELERADVSRLEATGWRPPEPFTVKARDGVTDLYGLMFKPTDFDESRRYPIINNIYPGPQTGSVGSRSFSAARGDAQAIAELGFIVIKLDGMGTPWRSKSFHEAYYGDMADNTLPDQIAGMRQLAERHPWIDLERAGIYGHSGGGYATAGAMLHHPDFFKVGVSQAGNHDNRVYEDDWAEKWQGLLRLDADGESNYDSQANQNYAANLQGKLLLAHGSMDTNVPFYSTLLLVDALIAANKDFDLIILPNRGHGFGNEPYMMRRRWDYFVKHLMGAEPPPEYRIGGGR